MPALLSSRLVSALAAGVLLTLAVQTALACRPRRPGRQPTGIPERVEAAASAMPQVGAVGTSQWSTDCAATMLRTEAEQLTLPGTTAELLKLITVCGSTTQRLVSEGQFGSVYLPAMMGKDVALALEDHINELPEDRRREAGSAIRGFVLAAWKLDEYGDLGNREKLSEALNLFPRRSLTLRRRMTRQYMALSKANNKPIGFRIRMHHHWWRSIVVVSALGLVTMAGSGLQAHKTITSKYKYNNEVFPILRDRCGRCHVAGGQTPMSLMTYADAIPWAYSMREKLVGEAMPPWYADPDGPAVKGGYSLTTKELDILATWVTGGTPRSTESTFLGDKAPNRDLAGPRSFTPNLGTWKSGPPDLAVKMEAEYTLPAGTSEEFRDLTLPTGLMTEKWVKAVDLLPGTPAMVRDAVISVEEGPLLAPWVPGDDVVPAPSGAAFRLPAGAKLHLRSTTRRVGRTKAIPCPIAVRLACTSPTRRRYVASCRHSRSASPNPPRTRHLRLANLHELSRQRAVWLRSVRASISPTHV